MKTRFGRLLALLAPLASICATPATAQDYALRARPLADGVWVVEGANADFSPANGCNIINTGFIATDEGALVINTGPSRLYGEQLRALIERSTGRPPAAVLQLNLHPDHFFGNQAFADRPRWASAATRAGVEREAEAYENNLYRLCGDWMKGTRSLASDHDIDARLQPGAGAAVASGSWTVGGRTFELLALQGHTASDLVLIDRRSGIAFVGGLAFAQRVPTTPHADPVLWMASLGTLEQQLRQRGVQTVVPSHGPVGTPGAPGVGLGALSDTRDFLRWLDAHFTQAAAAGMEANELQRAPVPPAYRAWAAFDTEYLRNIAHLYPRYERAALLPPAAPAR